MSSVREGSRRGADLGRGSIIACSIVRAMVAEPGQVFAPRPRRERRRAFGPVGGLPKTRKKRCAKTTIFINEINLICPVQPSVLKYFSSVFQNILVHSARADSTGGAARDRHGRWRQDAVDVRMFSALRARRRKQSSRTTKACGPDPPTLGSSLRVTSPQAMEAIKPGTPGRARSSR